MEALSAEALRIIADRFNPISLHDLHSWLDGAISLPPRAALITFDDGYKRFPKIETAYQQNRIVDEPLRWGYLRDTIYGRLSHELLPRYEPDLAMVYFRGIDFVQLGQWPSFSNTISRDGTSRLRSAVKNSRLCV